MATLTLTPATVPAAISAAAQTKPSFFNRVLQAMIESRQRKAEIEARRVMALIGQPRQELDYAMLPFSGE